MTDEKKGNDKEEELAEEMLESFGFGGLVDMLKKSEVFKERLDQVNEKIRKNISSKDEGEPKVDFNFSIGSLKGKKSTRKLSTRPPGGIRKERETDQWRPKKKKKDRGKEKKSEKGEEEKPLVDLFQEEEEVRVFALFPGVEKKEELELSFREKELILRAGQYEERLDLPESVELDPQIRFKNGVFDIKFPRR